MRETLTIPPPVDYLTFSPSELFKFFFQIGRWTEDSFSADFQDYTRGKLISTVTINKWKNRDVIPTRYSGPLFKMIESQFEPDIAKDWIAAFETVWATHIARPKKTVEQTKDNSISDSICRQHCAWIQSRYEETLYGETFSTADIYVPLQLIDRKTTNDALYDIEDLLEIFSEDRETEESKTFKITDWTFICGGPGSGKSMAALHLAHKLTALNIFPIYLRGSHLSDIDIDIQNADQPVIDSFSIKSFLQHFRASSQKTACLILDGIDEISGSTANASPGLTQIIKDLRLEQNVCQAHGRHLHIVALGRHTHVEYTSEFIASETSKYLDMLGLDGRDPHSTALTAIGHDLRAEWWGKYLSAMGRQPDPILPDFLTTDYDDYSEFGTEPLLTYLICRLAFLETAGSTPDALPHERVNALTYTKNRNEIYNTIIKHIHSRAPLQNERPIEFNGFLSVLQHIALANWHAGDSRTVSLKKVRDSLQDEKTKRALQSLNFAAPGMLITAFYYRITQDSPAEDQVRLEFTHKTFSEYLISTLLFENFQQLLTAFSTKQDLNEALSNWSKISCAGAHEPSLAEFCQKEAALRYDSFFHLDLDSAFTLIRDHLNIPQTGSQGLKAITGAQRSVSLLFFLWSCLNIERQNRSGSKFKLFEKPELFSAYDLKRIQFPNALNLKMGSLTEPQLQYRNFLTPCLSALALKSADMSQLSFSIGHMQSLNCEESSFAMTHWSHVKITESTFHKTAFQQAIFHGTRWSDTEFSNCLFQAVKVQISSFTECSLKDIIFSQCHFSDVDFITLKFDGVIFDRCTFMNCHFNPAKESIETNVAAFRYCTFLEMQKDFENNSHHSFQRCIFQESKQTGETLQKVNSLNSNIEKLLL